MSLPALPALRARIAEILAPSRHPPGLPTGVEGLDALLPGGGLPIGRLTEVIARRGGGRTTVLRKMARETVRGGGWVAVVDASRTLAPRDWAENGRSSGSGVRNSGEPTPSHSSHRQRGKSRDRSRTPNTEHTTPSIFIIRPRRADCGAWCADLLLRTGAFALVVLDGAPPLSRQVAARLTRLARDAGAVLVIAAELPGGEADRLGMSEGATLLPGALRLRIHRGRTHNRPRSLARHRRTLLALAGSAELGAAVHRTSDQELRTPILVTIEKGGTRRTVEVFHAVGVARRLCAHPEVPDRRGVARSGKTAMGGGAASDTAVAGAAHPTAHRSRARRCAEPVYERERLQSALPAPPSRERARKEHAGAG